MGDEIFNQSGRRVKFDESLASRPDGFSADDQSSLSANYRLHDTGTPKGKPYQNLAATRPGAKSSFSKAPKYSASNPGSRKVSQDFLDSSSNGSSWIRANSPNFQTKLNNNPMNPVTKNRSFGVSKAGMSTFSATGRRDRLPSQNISDMRGQSPNTSQQDSALTPSIRRNTSHHSLLSGKSEEEVQMAKLLKMKEEYQRQRKELLANFKGVSVFGQIKPMQYAFLEKGEEEEKIFTKAFKTKTAQPSGGSFNKGLRSSPAVERNSMMVSSSTEFGIDLMSCEVCGVEMKHKDSLKHSCEFCNKLTCADCTQGRKPFPNRPPVEGEPERHRCCKLCVRKLMMKQFIDNNLAGMEPTWSSKLLVKVQEVEQQQRTLGGNRMKVKEISSKINRQEESQQTKLAEKQEVLRSAKELLDGLKETNQAKHSKLSDQSLQLSQVKHRIAQLAQDYTKMEERSLRKRRELSSQELDYRFCKDQLRRAKERLFEEEQRLRQLAEEEMAESDAEVQVLQLSEELPAVDAHSPLKLDIGLSGDFVKEALSNKIKKRDESPQNRRSSAEVVVSPFNPEPIANSTGNIAASRDTSGISSTPRQTLTETMDLSVERSKKKSRKGRKKSIRSSTASSQGNYCTTGCHKKCEIF